MKTLTELADELTATLAEIRKAANERRSNDSAPPEVGRLVALAVTNVENGLLWLGEAIRRDAVHERNLLLMKDGR